MLPENPYRHDELSDGTLMRMEGSKEFPIYREETEGFPFHVMTSRLINELQEYHRRRIEEKQCVEASGRDLNLGESNDTFDERR
jgi:hypothetical protein